MIVCHLILLLLQNAVSVDEACNILLDYQLPTSYFISELSLSCLSTWFLVYFYYSMFSSYTETYLLIM